MDAIASSSHIRKNEVRSFSYLAISYTFRLNTKRTALVRSASCFKQTFVLGKYLKSNKVIRYQYDNFYNGRELIYSVKVGRSELCF